MRLELCGVHAGYASKAILHGISFSLESKEVLCLLGPNGAGKSTLLKVLLGIVPLRNGQVRCNGEDMADWPRSKISQTIAYIPQQHAPTFQFTAYDMVLMGRTAHIGRFGTPSKADGCIAEEALDVCNLSAMKNTLFTEMSGGERQLVLIARALAQKARFLIMDEPTNNLDFGNQVRVLRHIQSLAQDNFGIIMASHYPDHAFLYSSKVLLLKNGAIAGVGAPSATATEEQLTALYGVRLAIVDAHLSSGFVKVCVPCVQ